MSVLSDEIGYREIMDRYFDAYNRLAEINAAPINEGGYLDSIKSTLTGDIPIERVGDYDKAYNNTAQYGDESTALNATLDDLKVSILEFLNEYTAVTMIFSRDKLRAIVPVDSENFDIVAWP